MNNTDFRRILLEESAASTAKSDVDGKALSSLGHGRQHIPLTPRNVKGQSSVDFFHRADQGNATAQPAKQFRSKQAPKGSKLAAGYIDRTRNRDVDAIPTSQDEREARLKALEEQFKLGQIDLQVFENLRDEITAGDITVTHLVKGLDRRLLERVKKGEDVLGVHQTETDTAAATKPELKLNEDEELTRLEQQDVAPVERPVTVKRGELVVKPTLVAGTKRSRADILADLKASRLAQQEVLKSQLGSRFLKVGEKKSSTRIERDAKGREVLITVDQDGRVKRKVRKTEPFHARSHADKGLLLPDLTAPLGMAVPTRQVVEEVEEDDDIFENVGTNYDPLGDGGVSKSDESGPEEDEVSQPQLPVKPLEFEIKTENVGMEPPSDMVSKSTNATKQITKGNYFGDSTSNHKISPAISNPLHDPSIMAALKRAAALAPETSNAGQPSGTSEPQSETSRRLLASGQDRDFADLDLGFGSSRFDDDDDEAASGGRRLLSEWTGICNTDGEGKEHGNGEASTHQRKRGKKKRKGGDKDSAADIFRVIEQRKAVS